MYKGFNLKITEDFLDEEILNYLLGENNSDKIFDYLSNNSNYNKLLNYLQRYNEIYDKLINEIYDKLNYKIHNHINKRITHIFNKKDATINLTSIGKNWFPKINANIFISHSHKDKLLAKKLSIWLYLYFGLNSFIDSTVWGYSKDLLENIINNEDYGYMIKYNLYDLEKTLNINTHIDILLSMAIIQMIDNCECLIFLNSPQSISRKNTIEITYSPWIYTEINIAKYIEKIVPKRLQNNIKQANFSREYLSPYFEINAKHLLTLKENNLIKWREKSKKRGEKELNYIYNSIKHTLYKKASNE